jgi:hypothetical protein
VLGPPPVDMVFLRVIGGAAVLSDPAGDAGSGVTGLAALDSSNMFSRASPRSDILISSSVKSISGGDSVVSVC